MNIALVLYVIISFLLGAHHACSWQDVCAYDEQKVYLYHCALPEQGSEPSFHGRRRLDRAEEWPFCSTGNQWMDKNKSFFRAVSLKGEVSL